MPGMARRKGEGGVITPHGLNFSCPDSWVGQDNTMRQVPTVCQQLVRWDPVGRVCLQTLTGATPKTLILQEQVSSAF